MRTLPKRRTEEPQRAAPEHVRRTQASPRRRAMIDDFGGGMRLTDGQRARLDSAVQMIPGVAERHEAADFGTRGAGGPLPHLERIQTSFGKHDVTSVQTYTDGAARPSRSWIVWLPGQAVLHRRRAQH